MNHALAQEIEDLSGSANAGKVRLQLFIEWWVEYCSNHGDVVPWLEGAESRLEQLVARAESTQSPLVSPVELLQDAKVHVYQCCGDVIMMSWCQSLDVIDSIHTQRYQTPALSIGTLVYQYKCTRVHTHAPKIYTRAHACANIQTFTHTYLQHTHTHTCTHPHVHTHTHACIHTHTRTHSHQYTHAHAPTHPHHAHTHTGA